MLVIVCVAEDQLCKESTLKSELEAEVTKCRRERDNLQEQLHKLTVFSDGLQQDKIDLNKIIVQVHHFVALFTVSDIGLILLD